MADDLAFAAAFLDEARRSFRGYKRLADGALAQVDDRGFFHVPDPESNSIAILVKHISGNLRSRWTDFLTTDGEKPDRNRDTEFEIYEQDAKRLTDYWQRAYSVLFATMDSLTEDDLLKTVTIRQEPHTVIQAIQRQIAHYGYHIGQIVGLAKQIKGSDWKTLSIPRGKSEEYLHGKFVPPKG